jgi:hypothetical protein
VVFTAVDDNSIGEPISGGNPSGYYANPALCIANPGSSVTLANLRVCYARQAVLLVATSANISHVQFPSCQIGLSMAGSTLHLKNALFASTLTNFIFQADCNVSGEHLTCRRSTFLATANPYPAGCYLRLTNSIFSDITNLTAGVLTLDGSHNGFHGVTTPFGDSEFFSTAYPFQSAGAGAYYLAEDSFRRIGLTTISPDLLRDLKTRTTQPPTVISDTTITSDTNFTPQVAREIGSVDLGYAYDPLDYLLAGITAQANLTFSPGTAVGWFVSSGMPAIELADSTSADFNGTATDPCYWVRRGAVQENLSANADDWVPGGIGGSTWPDFAQAPQVRMRFTRCSILGCDGTHMRDNDGYLVVHARDCEFWGGGLGGYCSQLNYTNCLLDRVTLWNSWDGVPTTNCTLILQNCLMRGGVLNLNRWNGNENRDYPLWFIHDTAFDNISTNFNDAAAGSSAYTAFDYNAYLTGANTTVPTGDNDITLDTFNWQSNRFGSFYLPSDSRLKNSGSTTADIPGLFHFTTQTNQEKELSSQVDRSYHYVAVDGGGNPFDANANDLPDYLDPDSDSDGLPDWWEIKYFGDLTQVGDSSQGLNCDYDGDGVDNATEYLNGTDPNKILFTVSYANDYVSGNTLAGTIQVSQGYASQMAVMINTTDFASALWVSYSSNFTATLPAEDSRYTVWVGLRGRAADSQVTWTANRISRDTAPPPIVVTNPTATTTSWPLIQLYGYSTDPLISLRYDVSNANGLITNLQGSVSHQFFDTNLYAFTTNYFQCFDIDLANGDNIVTIRATDLAGNTTVTNFTYTLETDTDPPVVMLGWPLDGTQISGDSFTVDGWLDDPTAKVTATLEDGSSNTSTFTGLVERNGRFWVENIQLPSGVSTLTLTATDIWGNTASTTTTLTRSTLGLTISLPDPSGLHLPSLDLAGSISDPSYAVWVNGTPGINKGDGSWQASAVPVPSGGTATFEVTAYPPGHEPAVQSGSAHNPADPAAVSVSTSEEKPDRYFLVCYTESQASTMHVHTDTYYDDGCKESGDLERDWSESHTWQDGQGGAGDWSRTETVSSKACDGTTTSETSSPSGKIVWPATFWDTLVPGAETDNSGPPDNTTSYRQADPPYIPMPAEYCSFSGRFPHGGSDEFPGGETTWTWIDTLSRGVVTEMSFYVGGKSIPHQQFLLSVLGNAQAVPYFSNPGGPIDNVKVTLGAFGNLGADGWAYMTSPGDATVDVTAIVPGYQRYVFTGTPQKHKLTIWANEFDLSTNTPEFCVGQRITLQATWDPSLPNAAQTSIKWLAYPDYVNRVVPASGESSVRYVYDPSMTANNPTDLWWYEAGGAVVWCNTTSTFANGQTVPLDGRGEASVVSPSIVAVQLVGATGVHYFPTLGELGFTDTNGSGMEWRTTVRRPDHFGGTAWHTQLVDRTYAYDTLVKDFAFSTDGDHWLDTDDPYHGTTIVLQLDKFPQKDLGFHDAPDLKAGFFPFKTFADIKDDFHTYVRFQPSTPESIPVTIGRLDWQWHGRVQSPAWALTISNWSGPNFCPDRAPVEWHHVYTDQ